MSQELKKKNNEKPSTWNIKPYLAMGLTALIVIVLGVSFFFFVYRYQGASELFALTIQVLQPIVFGLIIAYLLTPLVNKIDKLLKKHTKLSDKVKKAVSIVGAMLIAGIGLFLFFWAVIPEVYRSVEELVISMPQMINETVVWLQEVWESNKYLSKYLDGPFASLAGNFQNFVQTNLLPQAQILITEVTTGIFAMAKGIFNFIIGFIVSIYVLLEKEHLVATGKKLTYGLFSERVGNVIVHTGRKAHQIFSGFVVGKIIDSIIIGILTFIILSIVKMPSALLVSVIVGVTNVIPFFGPFIGAIPSFFLILIQDPIMSLWFLVIILLIQQLDGNIIGPMILGDAMGLSSFWVITAILFSGGLFGVKGMILGVPVFALIYYIIDEIAKYFLRKKGLPEETQSYENVKERDIETGRLVFFAEDTVEKEPKETSSDEEK